jgi:hypothetical protein
VLEAEVIVATEPVAPELQEYVLAPVAVKLVGDCAQTVVAVGATVTFGNGFTIKL